MPACGRADRDRDLRQSPGDREQDHPAERLAEVVAPVDRIGRLRELDACDPGDGGRRREDADEER